MSDSLHLLLESALLWLAAALATSMLTAALYPAFARVVRNDSAATQARQLLAYALIPALAATLLVALALQPEWFSALVPAHCHGDQCAPHRPQQGIGSGLGLFLATGNAAVILVLLGLLRHRLERQRRQLDALQALSRPAPELDAQIVEHHAPMAWCAGWLRPRVYLTQGLLDVLPETGRNAVIAHEQAHRQRRDNLRAMILRIGSTAWPAHWRRQLWGDFALATEAACDAVAARTIGNPQPVVDALRQLTARHTQDAVDGDFSALSPAVRIDRLHRQTGTGRGGWPLIALLLGLQVALLLGPAHYALEWLMAASPEAAVQASSRY